MFSIDMQDAGTTIPQVVVAQNATGRGSRTRQLSVCFPLRNDQPFPPPQEQSEYVISPGLIAQDYLREVEKRVLTGTTAMTVAKAPRHGQLEPLSDNLDYIYHPAEGYFGKDQATFDFEQNGVKVRVIFLLQTVGGPLAEDWADRLCGGKSYRWILRKAAGKATGAPKTAISGGDSFYWTSGMSALVMNLSNDACMLLMDRGFVRPYAPGKRKPACSVVSIEKPPLYGTLQRQPDGTFKYTPRPGFKGNDSLQFIVRAEGKNIRATWHIAVAEGEINQEASLPGDSRLMRQTAQLSGPAVRYQKSKYEGT